MIRLFLPFLPLARAQILRLIEIFQRHIKEKRRAPTTTDFTDGRTTTDGFPWSPAMTPPAFSEATIGTSIGCLGTPPPLSRTARVPGVADCPSGSPARDLAYPSSQPGSLLRVVRSGAESDRGHAFPSPEKVGARAVVSSSSAFLLPTPLELPSVSGELPMAAPAAAQIGLGRWSLWISWLPGIGQWMPSSALSNCRVRGEQRSRGAMSNTPRASRSIVEHRRYWLWPIGNYIWSGRALFGCRT